MPVADADEGIPFPHLRTVRSVAHPNDGAALDFHLSPVAFFMRFEHSHILAEDMEFEQKQRLGAHIDRWHFPAKDE